MKKIISLLLILFLTTGCGPLVKEEKKEDTSIENIEDKGKVELGNEGLTLVDAAKIAFQIEQMNSGSKIKATSSVCFSLNWLNEKGYYGKSNDDGYYGSVLVKYEDGIYKFSFWISDGEYYFDDVGTSDYTYTLAKKGTLTDQSCGAKSYDILCSGEQC